MEEIYFASFSGGRSSAYMVHRLLEAGDPLDYIIFNNTGLETPETYEFLEACNEQLFDNRVVFLEFTLTPQEVLHKGKRKVKDMPDYKIVDIDSMDKGGEPFHKLIAHSRRLPNRRHRTCTMNLKVKTTYRYLYDRHDYETTFINKYLGFRFDERNPKRVPNMKAYSEVYEARASSGRKFLKWTCSASAPLFDDKIGNKEVHDFWRSRPLKGVSFDYSDPNLRVSNCAGCFFSSANAMVADARKYPDIVKHYDRMECKVQEWYPHVEGQRKHFVGFAEAHLDRKPTESELHRFSFSENGTWSMFIDAAKRPPKSGTADLFGGMHFGGCGDGECGLDL